jgi:predicted nucleic acid-binding Zn ribbon protein
MSKPERLREMVRADVAIGNALRTHGVTAEIRLQRIVFDWPEIVGARIAARTAPDGISRTGLRDRPTRMLWVRVVNSAWLQELTLLRAQLTASILAAVGEPPLFDEIKFHLGRPPAATADLLAGVTVRRARPAARKRPVAATGDRARAITDEVGAVEDPALRDLIREVRIRNDR